MTKKFVILAGIIALSALAAAAVAFLLMHKVMPEETDDFDELDDEI